MAGFMFSEVKQWFILSFTMEMTYAGIAAMFLGWIVGRLYKLSDVGTIVVITMAGGGSLITGLIYLWTADIIVGQSGTFMWFVVGAIGGVLGIAAYIFTRYLDWMVDLAKRNGLL